MDMTWITDRVAVGGAIWDERRMLEVVDAGITHILDMQVEFDDTLLAEPYFVEVLWNPVDDDFQSKPAEVFQRGVDFAFKALEDPEAKLLIHCAAGVHRAPMMMLALLRAQGWGLDEAMQHIQSLRPVADFADVYVHSVEDFVRMYAETSH
ncbi:MAG: dual specificity protein phosphatase family protein [Terriglobales bacterium]